MRNTTDYQIELLLLRHGMTAGNEEKRYIGRTEEDLSQRGREALAGKCFPGFAPKILFSSPMKRCLSTGQVLFPDLGPVVIPSLREIDFGLFEGKNYSELNGDPAYQAWIDSGGTMAFPEGESRQAFIERSLLGFQELLGICSQQLMSSVDNTLQAAAVVHGGTVMAVLSGYFGGDYYDYQVGNGEGYLVKLEGPSDDLKITKIEKVDGERK